MSTNSKESTDGKSLLKSKTYSSQIIKFQSKGTGITTQICFELQAFSFVIIRPLKSKHGTRPLFDFNADQAKGKFDGCISALSGEVSFTVLMNFFNADVTDWEYVVELFQVVAAIEQMPDKLVCFANVFS